MRKIAMLGVLALSAGMLITGVAGSAQATTPVPTAGVPSGTTLTTITGDYTASTTNQIVDSKDIHGKLIITGSNVTIINTKVETTAHTGNGIEIMSGGSAILVDSTVVGFSNSVAGGNYNALRLDVSDMGDDGFKVGDNTNIVGSYCHAVYVTAGAHSDCAQIQAGVTNVNLFGNYFDATGGNSALFIAPDLGPTAYGPLNVSGNYFNGGNFSLYAVDGSNGTYHNMRTMLIGNKFGNTHTYNYENAAEYFEYRDNVRDDTGAAV